MKLDLETHRLRLHRIWATTDPENFASQRVLEKCGLQREGLLRDSLLVRGQWRSSLLYAILAPEFRAEPPQSPAPFDIRFGSSKVGNQNSPPLRKAFA